MLAPVDLDVDVEFWVNIDNTNTAALITKTASKRNLRTPIIFYDQKLKQTLYYYFVLLYSHNSLPQKWHKYSSIINSLQVMET